MKRILVMGPGGLGEAFADVAKGLGHPVDVAGRNAPRCQYDHYLPLQLSDDNTYRDICDHIIREEVGLIINTLGVLYEGEQQPEKTISQFNPEWFLQSMQVNCLSSMRILKLLNQRLTKDSALNFIALSARVSSIEDNKLGGWLSYRASKAALNMSIRTTAIEWQRKFKRATIVGYHPGTVDTKLSQPFQANVKTLFSAEKAAHYLYDFSQSLSPEKSGFLYDWQQKKIPF